MNNRLNHTKVDAFPLVFIQFVLYRAGELPLSDVEERGLHRFCCIPEDCSLKIKCVKHVPPCERDVKGIVGAVFGYRR